MRTDAGSPLFLIASFSLLFALGFLTGQTGIPVEDGGEILTVARLGGVNHPPGMPLLSLCSRLSWVLFGTQGLRVLFAILASLSLLLLSGRPAGLSALLLSAGIVLIPAAAGRILIWDAYGPLLLFFAAAFVRRPGLSLEGGLLTGLALAVHPQGILLVFLLGFRDISPLRFLGGLILGMSLYLALPLGSAAGTIVDWGNAGDISHFLRQVTAGGYREVYGGSMGGLSLRVLLRHAAAVRGMLWPVLIVPAVLGAVYMAGRERRLLYCLLLLAAADALFVLLVNPMASGTGQTGVVTLFVIIVLSGRGLLLLQGRSRLAGMAMASAVLVYGAVSWKPLPDQTPRIRECFAGAPPNAGFFFRDNDLLYGGWVMKYVQDLRPDIVLLSTGNFSGWFEDMSSYFNPDLDLSRGILDVGNLEMDRDEAALLLMRATIEDNPGREFFSDFR